nr:response regulator [Nitrospirota bacterium]
MVAGGWAFVTVHRALDQSFQNTARMAARHTMESLDRTLFERYGDMLIFSQLPLVRALDRQQLPVIADHLMTAYAPYYRLALAVDRKGTILAANRVDGNGRPAATAQLIGQGVAGEPWFERALNASEPVAVEDFHVDALVQAVSKNVGAVLSLSAPIRNEKGLIVGVWSVRIGREPLQDILSLVSRTYSSVSPLPMVLLNGQGEELMGVVDTISADAAILATEDSSGFGRYRGLGWRLRVYQPVHSGHIHTDLAWVTGTVGVLILGGMAGLGWIVARRVIKPVRSLAVQARQLAHWKLGATDPSPAIAQPIAASVVQTDTPPVAGSSCPRRDDDIGDLQQAFATMTDGVCGQLTRLHWLNTVSQELQREVYSLPRVLQIIVESAAHMTGAQYGALGVFDETGDRLTQLFITGMDEATQRAIGTMPTGKGVLGYLAKEEGVVRIKNLSQHPASVGFPPNHPPMGAFLGVSIRAHGRLFGRIYLTNKQTGDEFTPMDEETILALATQAGTAIENTTLILDIQAAQAKYRLLLESTGEGIYGLDLDGACTFINRAGAAMLGYTPDELFGKPLHRLIHHRHPDGSPYPDEECPIHGAMRTSTTGRMKEEVFWRRDGTAIAVEYSSYPVTRAEQTIGAVVTFTDITERIEAERTLRTTEEQLRQAQKMDAVGQLAGGIAHDFNNLLTVINGYSETLLHRLDPADPRRRYPKNILEAGGRAAALTDQLLAFSRRQSLQARVIDLNGVVAGMEQMLRRLIGDHIVLTTTLHPGPLLVMSDTTQLEQVLLNLAVNARDAMAEGGTLAIVTDTTDIGEAAPSPFLPQRPGTYAKLTARDTGCGMDEQTQAHIFEPFFTTKGGGKGTGLGLSTTYGIIKQSEGHIVVESKPGLGTTFTIYLPTTDAPIGAEMAPAPTGGSGGSETILLVEDEPGVRELAREFLCEAGYTVLEAQNGADALRLCQSCTKPIHLVVTDVMMPGLNGPELAEQLAAMRPGIQVLYMSGYTDEARVHWRLSNPEPNFLMKPFSSETLVHKVRAILDARTIDA